MSRSLLACIVNDVQLCCKNQPKLRKKAALLARDIAAVCIGLRTAIMVDYMRLTAAAILAILAKAETQAATLQQAQCNILHPSPMLPMMHASLLTTCLELKTTQHNADLFMAVCNSVLTAATAAHVLHDVRECWDSAKQSYGQPTMQLVLAGPHLTLLQLDDCLYLVRHDALQPRLEQMSTCHRDPAYIAVSNVNGIPCLTMASEHDVKDVTRQLQHMCNLILSATPGRNDSSCTLMDLTSVEGMPIMPTMSGWLLQYPVVYLAHPETAVMMAQLLSEAVLVLYDVQVAGLFIEDLEQLPASQCQLASLYAFTVPETLLSNCSVAISRWEIDVAERCLPTATSNVLADHTIASCRLAPHHVQI